MKRAIKKKKKQNALSKKNKKKQKTDLVKGVLGSRSVE